MFSLAELENVAASEAFRSDFIQARLVLIARRLGDTQALPTPARKRLAHFIESVLASASREADNAWRSLCTVAAESAEALAVSTDTSEEGRRQRLRAALLYEMADLPIVATAVISAQDLPSEVVRFFRREGGFRHLEPNYDPEQGSHLSSDVGTVAEAALTVDARSLSAFIQGSASALSPLASTRLADLAPEVSFGLTGSELHAFEALVNRRLEQSTRSNVQDDHLFNVARQISFPSQLLVNQAEALRGGLLDERYNSWGLSSPTGTGKSFLTRLLILSTLLQHPERKVIYIAPTRALVAEITSDLSQLFDDLGIKVLAITPQLIELDDEEDRKLAEASVLVLTPEKADLLLRVGASSAPQVGLVIIDEAHSIEDGTRGVLLELYLWRLRRMTSDHARFVFLSAVAPNIGRLAQASGDRPRAITSGQRSTRMRVGVYRIRTARGRRQGWIDFTDGISWCVLPSRVSTTQRGGIVQLAARLGVSGPVLIVARGKPECERIAEMLEAHLRELGSLEPLTDAELASPEVLRLDSRLEREMYPTVVMRRLIRSRVAYHHAGLPPRVRVAVEDAVRRGVIRYVVATTTLAEGVNFPFSTVIVQSLALQQPPEYGRPSRYSPVTPRRFWNIAGRAGRPGYDREGQVILFEPSLRLKHIQYVLDDYLNPDPLSVEPVRSALADSIVAIRSGVEAGRISLDELSSLSLSSDVPENIRGAVNLLRVGIIHARAARLIRGPEEILEGTFAQSFLEGELGDFARSMMASQGRVVEDFLQSDLAPSAVTTAQLGLSMETLADFSEYVKSLEDWQLRSFNNVIRGGEVVERYARYVVGPVSRRMAELSGRKLGGILSEIIMDWIAGLRFLSIRKASAGIDSLEDLISILYSRIQYLLPWGLYAFDRIVHEEARRRRIGYGGQIQDLAYLADAGVPHFEGLRLVAFDFERVDATRLGSAYRAAVGRRRSIDLLSWLLNLNRQQISRITRGEDRRRVDYDLDRLLSAVRYGVENRA
jgi:superfamily II DNA/RNA helicase